MTQEDKELLFKDLCGRLPYGVICNCNIFGDFKLLGIDGEQLKLNSPIYEDGDDWWNLNGVKPYLRPMSSMTDKELVEFLEIKGMNLKSEELLTFREGQTAIVSTLLSYSRHIDWLNSHHFDYRGLIEKGLALEAPEGMYRKEAEK